MPRYQAHPEMPQNVQAAVAHRRRRPRAAQDSPTFAVVDKPQDDRGAFATLARALLLLCGLAGAVALGIVIGLLLH